ncbi:TPR repeat protein [Robiginitalea biformata HTCC2501]|uniref:TPR repeat protein n=2 Tax=Robiginitalea TaxID=252306 RepID=A4CHP8_ROBBH|nr:TPR repeat protein [Robiginitalea biformata HTCC2501]
MNFDEISRVAQTLQQRYEANQNYLYALKNWILDLKPQIQEESFINRLNGEYSILESMEEDDLARATKALKQRENAIKKIVSDYNVWVNQQNQSRSTSNSSVTNSRQNSNTGETLLTEGVKKFNENDFISAIRNFSKYLEQDKNNTDVLFYRALSKSNINDNYGAIEDYEKIIRLKSNYPLRVAKIATVYNNKAYALVKLGKIQEALPFVETALEMDKSEWFIWDTRGEIHYELGNYKESISDLTKAIKIEENEHSYYLRGMAQIKIGLNKMGCIDLSKAGQLGNDKAYEEIEKYCNN